MMKYLRLLLFPFSLIYGLVVILRNWFYDTGIFKSHEFDLPIISVGNLEVGGAGKSPMTEYLIRLFKNDHQLATLSRGYGRKTRGYLMASAATTAAEIGDEPAQFKHKFPDISVAVCEKRVNGIQKLQNVHDLILMDDAYQHRAVKPGFSILLFDYQSITNSPQILLPAGNLREPLSGRWRADILIVSKCPADITIADQDILRQKIKPLNYQQLFFTGITYLPLQTLEGHETNIIIDSSLTIFLLTGIANPAPLVQHLTQSASQIVHHNYPDHHQFTLKNISKLAAEFSACTSKYKIIITTEKDAQRLGEQQLQPLISRLPVYVIPIGINFLNNGQQEFDQSVKNYVREYSKHHTIH